jgi:hypothetical protein
MFPQIFAMPSSLAMTPAIPTQRHSAAAVGSTRDERLGSSGGDRLAWIDPRTH